jgi:Spy/CpxP family protein refolding chaperone
MSSHVKGALGVALIFILGAITGAVITEHFEKKDFEPRDPQTVERLMRESMIRELEITNEQLPAFHRVMDERRIFFQGLMREAAPRVDAVMQRTNQKLYKILTPEQRTRFEEIEKRRREDMRKMAGAGRNRTYDKSNKTYDKPVLE